MFFLQRCQHSILSVFICKSFFWKPNVFPLLAVVQTWGTKDLQFLLIFSLQTLKMKCLKIFNRLCRYVQFEKAELTFCRIHSFQQKDSQYFRCVCNCSSVVVVKAMFFQCEKNNDIQWKQLIPFFLSSFFKFLLSSNIKGYIRDDERGW